MQKFSRYRSMRQRENSQKRKCKVYCYKLQRQIQIINYNYLHTNIFSFVLSSVISLVSVTDSEHVFVCWERYFRIRMTIVVFLILKIPFLVYKYFLKVRNSHSGLKSVKSQQQRLHFLINNFINFINMSETFFQVFLWCTLVLQAIVYCNAFILTISFFIIISLNIY